MAGIPMNLDKSHEFFKPEELTDRIHIIGCGSVGSTIAENLARFGIKNMTLYDFDVVEPHNIANQMFTSEDIGKPKVQALAEYLEKINPAITDGLKIVDKGWTPGRRMAGYIFLAVDNIDLRREILQSCIGNTYIKAVFDIRTRLTSAQHFAADMSQPDLVQALMNSMAFSHEEAKEATPVSACNVTLSVAPTIRVIVAYAVTNFINFVQGKGIHKFIEADAFSYDVLSF